VHEQRFVLRVKSAAWRNPDRTHRGHRLSELSMTVERDDVPLGGHNIQVVLGAPDQPRAGLNEDVALWLDSGWWVTLRNQFALAPAVATTILESAADELSRLTERVAEGSPPGPGDAFWQEIVAIRIEAAGPGYWR
jgi:hypothetical protein